MILKNRYFFGFCILLSAVTAGSPEQTIQTRGAAATAHPLATQTADEVYRRGGNSVDAAIAVSLVLSVVEPTMSGLGGRAQALVRLPSGAMVGYNGMTEIPDGFTPSPNMPESGYTTVATPGLVAMLWKMHSVHGKLPFSELVQPAIEYAERGFVLLPGEAARHKSKQEKMRADPGMREHFLHGPSGDNVGVAPESTAAGDLLSQPVLAQTLSVIARGGADAFYRGDIARLISADMEKNGGFVSGQDLADYQVLPGRYIRLPYRDVVIHTLAAPAGGGLVVRALSILNLYDVSALSDASWALLVSQALGLSFDAMSSDYQERYLELLTDPQWAKEARKSIRLPQLNQLAQADQSNRPDHTAYVTDWIGTPDAHTSHFVTADCSGQTVSVTQTLGPVFGANVATPELGFVYAATMGGYLRTGIQTPGDRPRTSIAPVIITRNDKVIAALGAAGGIRIPSAIVQTISRYIDQGKSLRAALAAPRIHPESTINDSNQRVVNLDAFDAEMSAGWTEQHLQAWDSAGFSVKPVTTRASFGRVHAVEFRGAKLSAAADPDWEGTASATTSCAKDI
jgi:gamma-glutamyltranspeptidase/glutathione hydrolase